MRSVSAVNRGAAAPRTGGMNSIRPSAVLSSPGMRTNAVARLISAPSPAAARGSVNPERNCPIRRSSWDPAIGATTPQPSRKVASSTSRVQPQPIVDTNAKVTASSTTA